MGSSGMRQAASGGIARPERHQVILFQIKETACAEAGIVLTCLREAMSTALTLFLLQFRPALALQVAHSREAGLLRAVRQESNQEDKKFFPSGHENKLVAARHTHTG